MSTKEELLLKFSEIILFVEKLRKYSKEQLTTPLGEGKWTPKDVISHIMFWDRFYLENAIVKLTTSEPIAFKSPNFTVYNQEAVHFARDKEPSHIFDVAIDYRSKILKILQSLDEAEFAPEYRKNGFPIYEYIIDFVDHDHHHMKQLVEFLCMDR